MVTVKQESCLYLHRDVSEFPTGLATPEEFFIDLLTIDPQLDTKFDKSML